MLDELFGGLLHANPFSRVTAPVTATAPAG
jgi:hypothetical protein